MTRTPGRQPEPHYLEAELRAALRDDPTVFDFLEHSALDGIWFWDLDAPDHEWLSPGFWRTLGYDPADKDHSPAAWQDLIHPEDLQLALANFEAHRRDPDHPYDQIVRYRHREGHQVWIRCRGMMLREEGRPLRMLGTHIDVSNAFERGADALQAERDRAHELEAAYRNLAQFTSFASHDLQAPLRTISGFLTLLSSSVEDRLNEEEQNWLHRVQAGAERMQVLIDGLLTWSRAQNRELADETVSVGALLEQVGMELAATFPDIQPDYVYADLPRVRGDSGMLYQLFLNLLGNSIKYRSEAPPRIEVQCRQVGDQARFTISDNGIGIPAEYRESVFEAFRRLHSQKAIEGSGLGLAIVRRIVERHGGRIELESEPGAGARFHFTLPLAAKAESS